MGSLSISHWVIVLAIALIVFGGGQKIASTMGDVGKGFRLFRSEMKDSVPLNIPSDHP